jgi:membrane-bound lytic murein transglycosylase A
MHTLHLSRLALTISLSGVLAGCAVSQKNIEIPGETPVKPVGSATSTPSSTQPEVGGSTAGISTNFATQGANYSVIGFDKVPGWSNDNFVESWPAFLESCKVLSKRGAPWVDVCNRSRAVDATSLAAVRGFYEREFAVYQIQDDDRKIDGVVTGYFEPEINGSRRYGAPFIYPVYAQPDDMLFLDARKLAASQRTGTFAARLDGRNVSLQNSINTKDIGGAGLFAVDMSSLVLDTLDKKVRLRANGKQLVPYYTREEIETLGAPNAKVLAFVDNANALYEMQVQGSGRIRLRENNEVMRVTYAEQNGHPFRPNLVAAKSGKPAIKVRGRSVELDAEDDEDEGGDAVRTRGFKLAKPAVMGTVAVSGQKVAAGARPVTGSGIKDPSYVFFRESATKSGGPVGALGVPLSPGRSIAVDPRSTPLGYPVFISTKNPTDGSPMRRLTIAQDTGGAIRGPVRADYFFGDGPQAATQARRMKERGQLWLLLPRGLKVAAASAVAGRTRGASATAGLAQCLVPTEDICEDDQ